MFEIFIQDKKKGRQKFPYDLFIDVDTFTGFSLPGNEGTEVFNERPFSLPRVLSDHTSSPRV